MDGRMDNGNAIITKKSIISTKKKDIKYTIYFFYTHQLPLTCPIPIRMKGNYNR